MSLGSIVVTETFSSSGVTTYNIGIEYIEATAEHVMVITVGGTLQDNGVDYTIAEGIITRGIGQSFDLNFMNVPGAGAEVIVSRETDRLQSTQYLDEYDNESHESRTDKTMMVSQEIEFKVENPGIITAPTAYPTGFNKYAQWSEDGSVLESATSPMTYQDNRMMQIGDIVYKDQQIWICNGDGGFPFRTAYNNFNGEVNDGWWKPLQGNQGEAGSQGPQGATGPQGNTGVKGDPGFERWGSPILNDVVNQSTNIFMEVGTEETVKLDIELIREDDAEERRSFIVAVAIQYGGSWTIRTISTTGVAGPPIGVTFALDPASGELLYTSDDMVGTGYVGTLRLYAWRFD